MFLTEDDYKSQIRDFDLDDLTDNNDPRRQQAELRAQAEIESYLRDRYHVEDIFNQTGANRNSLIVMNMIDISIYHLFCAISPRNIPDIRVERYRCAIKWLDMVCEGKLNPALPANTTSNGDQVINTTIRSNPNNSYCW